MGFARNTVYYYYLNQKGNLLFSYFNIKLLKFRIGALLKNSVKSKVSIFVEFALQLLSDILKIRPVIKQNTNDADNDFKIEEKDQKLLELLSEFVPLMIDCLRLKFSKVILLRFLVYF